MKNGFHIIRWLWVSRVALGTTVLLAVFVDHMIAQNQPTIKVKVDVSPAINVSKLDESSQISFSEEIARLNELLPQEAGEKKPVGIGPGFAISAYENISVLVRVRTPLVPGYGTPAVDAPKVTCGYLNDGTTYFRRATITNKTSVEFRLRNDNLLRQSMRLSNSLLTAYIFLIVNERKEATTNEAPVQVSTVTVEFL